MDQNVRAVFGIISIIRAEEGGILFRLLAGATFYFLSKAYRPVLDLLQPRMQWALLDVSPKVK